MFISSASFGLPFPRGHRGTDLCVCGSRWVFVFGQEVIELSEQHPLVSGHYKIMAMVMQLCEKNKYFQVRRQPVGAVHPNHVASQKLDLGLVRDPLTSLQHEGKEEAPMVRWFRVLCVCVPLCRGQAYSGVATFSAGAVPALPLANGPEAMDVDEEPMTGSAGLAGQSQLPDYMHEAKQRIHDQMERQGQFHVRQWDSRDNRRYCWKLFFEYIQHVVVRLQQFRDELLFSAISLVSSAGYPP